MMITWQTGHVPDKLDVFAELTWFDPAETKFYFGFCIDGEFVSSVHGGCVFRNPPKSIRWVPLADLLTALDAGAAPDPLDAEIAALKSDLDAARNEVARLQSYIANQGKEDMRDKFAMAALTGLLAFPNGCGSAASISEVAYDYADAMLAERENMAVTR